MHTEITLTVAEKIAKEHIKRGKLANKKELLDLASNAKKSMLLTSVDQVFEADVNKVRLGHAITTFASRPHKLRCCTHEQDGSIDMEEWKEGLNNNAAIKSLINPSRSVYLIQEAISN
jgi:hypothetical protein